METHGRNKNHLSLSIRPFSAPQCHSSPSTPSVTTVIHPPRPSKLACDISSAKENRLSHASEESFCTSNSNGSVDLADNDGRMPYDEAPIKIMPFLYLGSEKNASQLETLRKHNIGYILNVGLECRNHFMPAKLSTEIPSSSKDDLDMELPISPIYNPLNLVRRRSKDYNYANQDYHVRRRRSIRCDAESRKLRPVRSDEVVMQSPTNGPSLSTIALIEGMQQISTRDNSPVPSNRSSIMSMASGTSHDKQNQLQNQPQYLHLPWTHNEQNILADFPRAFQFIDEARLKERGVLVHCKQGVSRSSSLIIGYIMKTKRMRLEEAYAYVKSRSPNITPNLELIYQLKEYETNLFENADTVASVDNTDANRIDVRATCISKLRPHTATGSSSK